MKGNHVLKYFRRLIFLCAILTFYQANGQSVIYNAKGQLIHDTTLTINEEQYEIWKLAEANILSLISSNVKYPLLERDADMTGMAIVSFYCDSVDIRNITMIQKLSEGIDKSIVQGVLTSNERVLKEFKYQNSMSKQNFNYEGTYYIPFIYSLIDPKEHMKKVNAISIIDLKRILIEVR